MGWKTSMIFANSVQEFDIEELFNEMGIYELKKVDEQPFDSIMNPDDDRIYIGKFNGNTIICMQDLPLESLDESISRAEHAMSNTFSKSDIVTFALHSVVNLWGYSIVRNGEKIRVRAGSSEGGTMVEYGNITKEEEGLMSQSRINESGKRVFKIEGLPDEEFEDDQVGENFVFSISAKYFGESLDCSDEIFETTFVGYTYSKTKLRKIAKSNKEGSKTVTKTKPWWKFW